MLCNVAVVRGSESLAAQSSGPDVAAIATGTISFVGCIAVAAAGTATAKYIDVRRASQLLIITCFVTSCLCCSGVLLTQVAAAQTEVGLYIFWAIYVVVIGAYVANRLGGAK